MTDVEVSVRVQAPAEKVWGLVGDLTRMGEWSPECTAVSWVDGATGPAVGARFRGSNRRGARRWSTTGTLTRYEPGRALGWDVSVLGMAVAHWAYRVEPDGEGCTIVESFTDRRGALLTHVVGPLGRGVRDAAVHNRAGMERTLAALKAAAES
jgi:uncharacterized protein YndB with AHSA1/START domain